MAAAQTDAATLPWSWYSDPDVWCLERERIFASAWQYAGHAGLVATPGDYFTCRAGETPIVVVRDREGELNAFLNVCRHRGAEVVSGAGRCTTLQCHYHAWTYGLDGALRAAPRAEREPGFERAGLSLVRAQVDTWGPFVFVNPDPDAGPLADTLGALPGIVAAGGLDLDALTFHSRVEYELQANWKVAVENYLECYHCQVAHPGFSDVIDVGPDAYRLEEHPTFASHYGPVRASRRGPPPYDTAGAVAEGQFHMIWPAIKFNVMPGRSNLSIGPLVPVAPEHTTGYLDYFFGPEVDDAWIADMLELDNLVGAEDLVLVESVQRGMRGARGIGEGRLMLSCEHLIDGFGRWLRGALER